MRLPKAVRVAGTEVMVRKRGTELVIETLADRDDWVGFWERLVPLRDPVKRQQTARAEKRKPL